MRRLLIRPGGIGDCLLCFPALEDLKPAEVWVPSAVVPLVRFAPHVRSIADTGLDTLGIPCRQPSARLVDGLRSFEEIVSWYGSGREEFRAALESLGVSVDFRAALPAADSAAHAVDFFLGVPSARYPSIPIPRRDNGFIAIHPFSGSTHKNWPLANFRELEAGLPLPARYCASVEQMLPGALQYPNLYDLAQWLAGASLYIGNDSGITHLAAAVGVPTVAIFGYSNPTIWAPRGPHVRVVHAPAMDAVDPARVLAAASDLLFG